MAKAKIADPADGSGTALLSGTGTDTDFLNGGYTGTGANVSLIINYDTGVILGPGSSGGDTAQGIARIEYTTDGVAWSTVPGTEIDETYSYPGPLVNENLAGRAAVILGAFADISDIDIRCYSEIPLKVGSFTTTSTAIVLSWYLAEVKAVGIMMA